jgi:hypothetical protein
MDYLAVISVACSKISEDFFHIEAADGDPVWRERVYAYELYHQVRLVLGDDFPLRAHGELDKSGHEHAQGLLAQSKPDLVLHVPGQHGSNELVVEIKAAPNGSANSIYNDDYEKLRRFTDELGQFSYKRGLFLVYGTGAIQKGVAVNALLAQQLNPKLRIIVNPTPGHAELLPLPF